MKFQIVSGEGRINPSGLNPTLVHDEKCRHGPMHKWGTADVTREKYCRVTNPTVIYFVFEILSRDTSPK